MPDVKRLFEQQMTRVDSRGFTFERFERRRDRAVRNQRIGAMVLAAVIGLAGTVLVVRAFQPGPVPVDTPPSPRPVFERTATINGISATSPSDWFHVDYWSTFVYDPGELGQQPVPAFEVSNFDPGLSTPVCGPRPNSIDRLPSDGVAILVVVDNSGGGPEGLCGGTVDATTTGTIGQSSFRAVMRLGSDVSEEDRDTAEAIWDSIRTTSGFVINARVGDPSYVLDGWVDGPAVVNLVARPSAQGGVTVSRVEAEPGLFGGSSVDSADMAPGQVIEGDTFGLVTESAARVECRLLDDGRTFVARVIDLPASLGVALDAFAVVDPLPNSATTVTLVFDAEATPQGLPFPFGSADATSRGDES
jgi:hypothetical protein